MDRIPVYILTGFLGSGKTTALNHLLTHFKDSNNVVIENEFGKIAIDTGLVKTMYSDIYELSNGCICCSLDDNLYNILCQIERNKNRPDNLFIETTGVADAGNVAAIFTRPDVRQVFYLKKIICMVDTENIEELLKEAPETVRQIVASDLIVLNKTDYLTTEYIDGISALMTSLNPFAKTIKTSMGQIPVEELHSYQSNTALNQTDTPAFTKRDNEHKMVSVSFSTPEAFDINKLCHALTVTLLLHYKQVYRIKGIIRIHGSSDKILLQSTGKSLHTETIDKWQPETVCESKIVIIGLGLKKEFIERLCRASFHTSVNAVII